MTRMIENRWQRSTRCESATCVEVQLKAGWVNVRQSADENRRRLAFTPQAWSKFVRVVVDGQL
jgi:hypothetical protein